MARLSLFLILILLNWIDYDTTSIMIARDGVQVEANPIAAFAISISGSVIGIWYLKLATLALCAITWHAWKAKWIYIILGLYTFICLMNIYTIGVH